MAMDPPSIDTPANVVSGRRRHRRLLLRFVRCSVAVAVLSASSTVAAAAAAEEVVEDVDYPPGFAAPSGNAGAGTTTTTSDETCSNENGRNNNDGSCALEQPEITINVEDECGLYIAESTIPNAGLGIFTAVVKKPGDAVGTGDVCIPVIDLRWNNGDHIFNQLSEYFWAGTSMGMDTESTGGDIEAYCPGLDCAINCHVALINVHKAIPLHDNGAGLHRAKDPGAGAITPYHNGTTVVSRYIPAGGELFKHYGDNWFETRPDQFGMTPLSEDYPAAEDLLRKFTELTAFYDQGNNKRGGSNSIAQDIFDLVRSMNTGSFESRTLNAIPESLPEAYRAARETLASLHQPNHVRSVAWLRQNGRCIDHIAPGPSTLPQAGRGAFATRPLKAGTIITTSPLHHVPQSDYFNQYNFTKAEDGTWLRLIDEVDNYQVLLNYCYGNREESTLLLCPYGAGVNYINHNKSLVNVRIRWAEGGFLAHNRTMVEEGLVDDVDGIYKSQLSFDYVATRDISKGEELFLDYGDEWQDAWDDHVAAFEKARSTGNNKNDDEDEQRQEQKEEPDPSRRSRPSFHQPDSGEREYATMLQYASAHEWNRKYGAAPLRTAAEQFHDPYPEHLELRCKSTLIRAPRVLGRYKWRPAEYGHPCRIDDRFMGLGEAVDGLQANQWYYTVVLEHDREPNHSFQDYPENEEPTVTWVERTDVPRSAIRFFDIPGTTDLHLPTAFRHEIGIPDDMFPDQWRNVQGEDEEDDYDDYEDENEEYEDEDDYDDDDDEYDDSNE